MRGRQLQLVLVVAAVVVGLDANDTMTVSNVSCVILLSPVSHVVTDQINSKVSNGQTYTNQKKNRQTNNSLTVYRIFTRTQTTI